MQNTVHQDLNEERRTIMTIQSKRLYLLREEKLSKALLKLGIPTMIGMMVSALYNLVDAFFVGRLGQSQMAAVSIVYPVSLFILGLGLLFGSGAASILSRLLGQNKTDQASKCASTALFTSLGIGWLLILLMVIFIKPLLFMLGSTQSTYPYAHRYGILFIVSLAFNIFTITVNNLIVSEGASTVSMTALLAGGIVNIILDPIFIFIFHMGIMGAAIATLISRLISTIIYIHYFMSGQSQFKICFKNFSPSMSYYIELIKIGTPMLVFQILTSLSLSLTNLSASAYGDATLAALGIMTRIMSLFSMALFGFMKGYQPLVGYNYGRQNMERVHQATRLAVIWSTGFCLIISFTLLAFSSPIINAFSNHSPAVLSVGKWALMLNAITFIGLGFSAVYSSYFMALGKAKQAGLISIGRQGIFFIPIILISSHVWGLNGIIASQPLSDIFSIIMVLFLIYKNKKEQESLTPLKAINESSPS